MKCGLIMAPLDRVVAKSREGIISHVSTYECIFFALGICAVVVASQLGVATNEHACGRNVGESSDP